MTVIGHVLRENALPAPARGYARDSITLGWDERLHGHGRRRSDGGVAFGLSLPRGTMLRGGDCLILDQAKTVVLVIVCPEVAGVEQLLEQQRIPFARATLAFTPASLVASHDH